MAIISDAFQSSFTLRKKEGESLKDYTRRFKTSRKILKYYLVGTLIIDKYVKTMDGYDGKILEKQTQW